MDKFKYLPNFLLQNGKDTDPNTLTLQAYGFQLKWGENIKLLEIHQKTETKNLENGIRRLSHTVPSNPHAAALNQRSHCSSPLVAAERTSGLKSGSSNTSGRGKTSGKWREASNSVPQKYRFGEGARTLSHRCYGHYSHWWAPTTKAAGIEALSRAAEDYVIFVWRPGETERAGNFPNGPDRSVWCSVVLALYRAPAQTRNAPHE